MTDQQGFVELPVEVTGGVDTHKDTHVAAAKDALGRVLGTQAFPATAAGFAALWAWLCGLGTVVAVGVEGTGSYGAGLARYLTAQGVPVVEVNRPNRQKRRQKGKSDPQDAINAAAAVQSGDATAIPKAGIGIVAAIQAIRTVRAGAVKSRTIALNQLDSLIVTAPAALRETFTGLTRSALLARCAALPTGPDLADPTHASQTALRRLAQRIQQLTEEIGHADTDLRALTSHAAPRTLARFGVGVESAAQLLATAGDNPDRMTSEAAFAHLCGVAPIEASSGRSTKHRLNRAGDRHANAALYRITIVRLRHCPRTQANVQKRTTEGLSKRDIIRCLKRYIAREIYQALRADYAALST
jgi:transposase